MLGDRTHRRATNENTWSGSSPPRYGSPVHEPQPTYRPPQPTYGLSSSDQESARMLAAAESMAASLSVIATEMVDARECTTGWVSYVKQRAPYILLGLVIAYTQLSPGLRALIDKLVLATK